MMRFPILAAICSNLLAFTAAAQQPADSVGIPDIPGYRTLKGDLHLHTVFSDGQVTPSFRVAEAKRDGLDFIALTDHIDYQGYPDDLKTDLGCAPALDPSVTNKSAAASRIIRSLGLPVFPLRSTATCPG